MYGHFEVQYVISRSTRIVNGDTDSKGAARKTSMPIIDVSQKSYRSLVRAAHKRGMSIDRFIQNSLEEKSELEPQDKAAEPNIQSPVAETTPAPVQFAPAEPTPRPRRAIQPQKSPNDSNPAFSALWGRIEDSAGEAISTKRGQDFTYEVDSGYLTVVESGARIPQSQFKKALGQWPQRGPSNMRGIYAASVVWAVLADERIISDAA
jgi:hypothetical protein